MEHDRTSGTAVVLETERLRLRPWRIEDAAFHRRLWLERDGRVPPHRRISPEGRPTVGELEDWFRHYEPVPAPGLLVAERKDSGEPIGYCGLVPSTTDRPDEPELAYEFSRAEWNQGFATEAVRAILTKARMSGYRHVTATVRDWNGASLRVLDKSGFSHTGGVERDPVHGDSLVLRIDLRTTGGE